MLTFFVEEMEFSCRGWLIEIKSKIRTTRTKGIENTFRVTNTKNVNKFKRKKNWFDFIHLVLFFCIVYIRYPRIQDLFLSLQFRHEFQVKDKKSEWNFFKIVVTKAKKRKQWLCTSTPQRYFGSDLHFVGSYKFTKLFVCLQVVERNWRVGFSVEGKHYLLCWKKRTFI